jgi:hypothetical protein
MMKVILRKELQVMWTHMAVIFLAVLTFCVTAQATDLPKPLARAHSHNDYEHARPLLDALDCGFCSIEADIYLVDGALLVAHDREDCRPERTLQALYLDPLRERAKLYGGRVFPGGPVETLLIDLKTEGVSTYQALHAVLEQYADILTSFTGDKVTERAVTVIISGNRPVDVVAAQETRYVAIDGRPPDLGVNPPASLYPLISSDWRSLFKWDGVGDMPADQKPRLDKLIQKAHEQDRRIRFWGLPAGPQTWQTLYDSGVDLLNADDLPGMQAFLLGQGSL